MILIVEGCSHPFKFRLDNSGPQFGIKAIPGGFGLRDADVTPYAEALRSQGYSVVVTDDSEAANAPVSEAEEESEPVVEPVTPEAVQADIEVEPEKPRRGRRKKV